MNKKGRPRRADSKNKRISASLTQENWDLLIERFGSIQVAVDFMIKKLKGEL